MDKNDPAYRKPYFYIEHYVSAVYKPPYVYGFIMANAYGDRITIITDKSLSENNITFLRQIKAYADCGKYPKLHDLFCLMLSESDFVVIDGEGFNFTLSVREKLQKSAKVNIEDSYEYCGRDSWGQIK